MRHFVTLLLPFRQIATAILMILLLANCSKDHLNNCRDGKCTYEYYDNTQLSISEEGEWRQLALEPGPWIVFKYEYQYDDEENIADDELTEILYFQIPAESSSYQIDLRTYVMQTVYFNRLCYCGKTGFEFPNEAIINCEKINDDTWHVTADLSIDYYETGQPIQLNFEADFTKN